MRRLHQLPRLLPPHTSLENYISWNEPLINIRGFSDPMAGFASDAGGVAFRLAGVGVGYVIGNVMGIPGGGILGAVLGYFAGAGLAKLGGEDS